MNTDYVSTPVLSTPIPMSTPQPGPSFLLPLVGIIGIIVVVVGVAWWMGAFSQSSWVAEVPAKQRQIPASWCYVGTDDGKRICLKVPTPTACGDITVYASESACTQQK